MDRAARVDPIRTLVEAGLLIGAGSDSPVTPLRPLLGVHSAVNHSNPAERVDPLTALRLFTLNGARLGFEEAEKGSLSPGKLADLVVLGADPLRVDPGEIKDIPVEQTIVGGHVVYSAD
jgi:predicted amidohydrolase YtcJ